MRTSNPIAEAEQYMTAVEAKILLAMRERAAGEQIDEEEMVSMFHELEAAIGRLRALKVSMSSRFSATRSKRP